MTTQSIIVYRNPLEAAIWESGSLGYIAIAIVAFFIVFMSLVKVFEIYKDMTKPKWRFNRKYNGYFTNFALTAGGAAALFTLWYMI